MLRAGPQMPMETRRELVEPVAVCAVEPWRRVRRTRVEDDLAWQQQFAAPEHLLAAEEPLGVVHVVAAPRRVHRPHLSRSEVEPGHPGVQQISRIGAGAPSAVLAQVDADTEVGALRRTLTRPAAGEVEHLAGDGRDRQRRRERIERVAVGAEVGQLRSCAHESAGQQLHAERQREAGSGVFGAHDELPRPGLGVAITHRDASECALGHPESRRPRRAAARTGYAGTAGPSARPLGKDRDAHRLVHLIEADGVHAGVDERERLRLVQLSGVGAPVHDRREQVAGEVEHEGDAGGAQRYGAARGGGGGGHGGLSRQESVGVATGGVRGHPHDSRITRSTGNA